MSSVDINLEICGESHQQGRQGNINSINDGHTKILLPTYIIPLTTGSCHSKTIKRILYMDVKRFVLSRVIIVGIIHLLRLYYSGRAFHNRVGVLSLGSFAYKKSRTCEEMSGNER